MAQTYDINVRLMTQGPFNVGPVVKSLRDQIGRASIDVRPRLAPDAARGVNSVAADVKRAAGGLDALSRNAASASRSLHGVKLDQRTSGQFASLNRQIGTTAKGASNVAASLGTARNAAFEFGQQLGVVSRRVGAFFIVIKAIDAVQSAFREGVGQAVAFQHEMVRLSQVGGVSSHAIAGISQEIGRLAVSVGTSSQQLAGVATTLKQAGLSADDTRIALSALAKTTVAPTFESITNTVEGSIAAMQQFGLRAKDLEGVLGSVNTVSAAFAVESDDLVTAIRKTGGAFRAASGDIVSSRESFNQLLALFTSVRQTTRESADEISTGLRTIFSRLQDNNVSTALKDLNVNLHYTAEEAKVLGQNVTGQFVGAYEAIRRISAATKGLSTTDPRFAQIASQIGGYRQISRVIPLLTQFSTAQHAYQIAQAGTNSLTRDAAKAQDSFAIRLTQVKEEFYELIRGFGEDKNMKGFLDLTLSLASGATKLAKALEPLLPLLAAFAISKSVQSSFAIGRGFKQTFSNIPAAVQAISVRAPKVPVKKAAGGVVPGIGSGDTVPASLEPGSFVMKVRSAKQIGYGRLAEMAGYQGGGETGKAVDCLLTPKEYVFTPKEARRIGLARLQAMNASGRAPGAQTPKPSDVLNDPAYQLAMRIKGAGGMEAMWADRKASGGLVDTPHGRVRTTKFGSVYNYDNLKLGFNSQKYARRRAAADPVTGELTPHALWYRQHRQSRYARRLGMHVPGYAGGGFVTNDEELLSRLTGQLADVGLGGIDISKVASKVIFADKKLGNAKTRSQGFGSIGGAYVPKTRSIVLNRSQPEKLVENLAHELFHAIDAAEAKRLGLGHRYASKVAGNRFSEAASLAYAADEQDPEYGLQKYVPYARKHGDSGYDHEKLAHGISRLVRYASSPGGRPDDPVFSHFADHINKNVLPGVREQYGPDVHPDLRVSGFVQALREHGVEKGDTNPILKRLGIAATAQHAVKNVSASDRGIITGLAQKHGIDLSQPLSAPTGIAGVARKTTDLQGLTNLDPHSVLGLASQDLNEQNDPNLLDTIRDQYLGKSRGKVKVTGIETGEAESRGFSHGYIDQFLLGDQLKETGASSVEDLIAKRGVKHVGQLYAGHPELRNRRRELDRSYRLLHQKRLAELGGLHESVAPDPLKSDNLSQIESRPEINTDEVNPQNLKRRRKTYLEGTTDFGGDSINFGATLGDRGVPQLLPKRTGKRFSAIPRPDRAVPLGGHLSPRSREARRRRLADAVVVASGLGRGVDVPNGGIFSQSTAVPDAGFNFRPPDVGVASPYSTNSLGVSQPPAPTAGGGGRRGRPRKTASGAGEGGGPPPPDKGAGASGGLPGRSDDVKNLLQAILGQLKSINKPGSSGVATKKSKASAPAASKRPVHNFSGFPFYEPGDPERFGKGVKLSPFQPRGRTIGVAPAEVRAQQIREVNDLLNQVRVPGRRAVAEDKFVPTTNARYPNPSVFLPRDHVAGDIPLSRTTHFQGNYRDLQDKRNRSRAENAKLGQHIQDRDELLAMGLIGPLTEAERARKRDASEPTGTPERSGRTGVVSVRDDATIPLDDGTKSNRQNATIARRRIGLFGHVTTEEVAAKGYRRRAAEARIRRDRTRSVQSRSVSDVLLGRRVVAGGSILDLPDSQRQSILEQSQELYGNEEDAGLLNAIRGGQADVKLNASGNVVSATERRTRRGNSRPRGRRSSFGEILRNTQIGNPVSALRNSRLGRGLGAFRSGGSIGSRIENLTSGYRGAALLGAAAYTPYLLEQGFGTVRNPTGSRRDAAHAQAIGGGLTGAAVGAQLGSLFGPLGTAAGAAAGGLVGFAKSLQNANHEIEAVKFEDSFKKLEHTVAAVADGRLDLRSNLGGVHGIVESARTEASRRVAQEGGGGNVFDRYGIAGGPLSFLSSGSERIHQDEAKQRSAKFSEILAPQLPALQGILNRAAVESARTVSPTDLTAGNKSQAELDRSRSNRLGGFAALGGTKIAQTIADIDKIPVDKLLEEVDRVILATGQQAAREKAVSTQADLAARSLAKFGRLGEALDAASTSITGLKDASDTISALFEGRVTSGRVSGFAGPGTQAGSLDREAFKGSLSFVKNSLGGNAAGLFGDFSKTIGEVDEIRRTLGSRISDAVGGGGLGEDAISGNVRGALGNYSKGAQARLGAAIDAFDPRELQQRVVQDPEKLAKDLVDKVFGDLENTFEGLKSQLQGHFNEQGERFAGGISLREQRGDTLDRASTARFGALHAAANLKALGTGQAGEDLLSLQQLRQPIVEQQNRLAGAHAFNPEAIGKRLSELPGEIESQRKIANNPGAGGEARTAAAQEAQANLTAEAGRLTKALEGLADTSRETTAIQTKLNQVERERGGQLSLTERLITSDPVQLRDLHKASVLSSVAVRQGNFRGFNPNQIGEVLKHLTFLGDLKIGDRTGHAHAERLLENSGAIIGTFDPNLNKARKGLFQKQQGAEEVGVKALDEIAKNQGSLFDRFIENLKRQNADFLGRMDQLIGRANVKDAEGGVNRAKAAVGQVRDQVDRARAVGRDFALRDDGRHQTTEEGLANARRINAAPQLGELRESLLGIDRLQGGSPLSIQGLGIAPKIGIGFDDQATERHRKDLESRAGEIGQKTGLTADEFRNTALPKYLTRLDQFKKGDILRGQGFDTARELNSAINLAKPEIQEQFNNRKNEALTGLSETAFGTRTRNGEIDAKLIGAARNRDQLQANVKGVDLATLADGFAKLQKAEEEQTRATAALTAALEKSKGVPAEAHAVGGPIFRSRGTDTVPAMLTPGEFVVNAAATRQNRGMLEEMNRKKKPVYRAAGGPIDADAIREHLVNATRYLDEAQHSGDKAGIAKWSESIRVFERELGTAADVRAVQPPAPARRAIPDGVHRTESGKIDTAKYSALHAEDQQRRQAAALKVIADAKNKEAPRKADLRFEAFKKTLGQRNVPTLRQSHPTGLGRGTRAYLDYFGNAIDSYKAYGADASFDDNTLGLAAKNRRQLLSRIAAHSRPGGSQDALNAHQELLRRFDESNIGRSLSKTNESRTAAGQVPFGSEHNPFARSSARGITRRRLLASSAARSKRAEEERRLRRARGYSGGGMISSGTDSVPAMLSEGEFVVSPRAARENAPSLREMNRRPIYRAQGGPVGRVSGGGGSTAHGMGIEPASLSALQQFARGFAESTGKLAGLVPSLEKFGQAAASLSEGFASTRTLAESMKPFADAALQLSKTLSGVTIPSAIQVQTKSQVEVLLNGGSLLSALKGDLANEVVKQVMERLPDIITKQISEMPAR